MKPMKLPKLQTGISMVELMIALLIGAFLTGGLIQMFITTKSTNKLQDAVSRVQENGRFALEFITQDVRMADYFMECSTADKDPIAITGTDNDSTDANIVDGTDTITVRQTTGPCSSRQINTITYFIRIGANNQPSLYKTTQITNVAGTITTNTDELIEGIENMQILYGVDTDPPIITDATQEVSGTPNYYVSADLVANNNNWDNVVAVQISLLAGTMDDNVTSQAVPYTYNGVTTTPTDNRMRRVYNATITLRNRLK
jgi:type IV pilus assembly protein PilW